MCKVLIFGCISVAMLMTTAYGASLSSEKWKTLQTLIKDLEILENIKNVSGWFSSINSFLLMFSTYFINAFCLQKLTFPPSSLQKIHLELYTPTETQVSFSLLFSEGLLRYGYFKMMHYRFRPKQLTYQKGQYRKQMWGAWIQCEGRMVS